MGLSGVGRIKFTGTSNVLRWIIGSMLNVIHVRREVTQDDMEIGED